MRRGAVTEAAPSRRRSDRLDRYQRRHRWLGFPLAVIYKFIDDQGVYLAALIAFYGFLSLFPLLLLLASFVGFLLEGNIELQQRILRSTINQFPLIGDNVETLRQLDGSIIAVVVGGVIAVYGGLGVAQATQHAMNSLWAVPRARRPNPLRARARSLLLISVGGLLVATTTTLSALVANTALLGGFGAWVDVAVVVAGTFINALLFTAGFRITTAIPLSNRQTFLGALINAVCWTGLQIFGAAYVRLVRGTGSTYGVFGVVFGLLGWIFLAAVALVISVEVNVVRTKRLYPRALLTPFTDDVDLTEADRRIYSEVVAAQRLKGFAVVDVRFRHGGLSASAQRSAGTSPAGARRVAAADEQVEIVDLDGTVVTVVDRARMRAERLRHRVAMIVVVHPERPQLLVHRRAEWKDLWPGRWDVAFGGIPGVGEPWEEAAVRELAEESGLQLEPARLTSLGTAVAYDDDDVAELTQAWYVRTAGPFRFADGEVIDSDWVEIDRLDDWAADHEVCPDTLAVLREHVQEL